MENQRVARRAVAAAEEIGPSPDFMARLFAGCPGEAERPSSGPLVPPGRTWTERDRDRRRTWTWSVAGAAVAGAVAVGGLFVIGGEPRSLVWADVTPDGAAPLAAVTRAALPAPSSEDSAWAQGTAPGGAAAPPDGDATAQVLAWMRTEGWVVPEVVPTDLAVVDVSLDPDGALVVVLEGADATVVITERRGRLDADAAGLGDPVVLGRVTAQVVDTSPWTAVVETADTVVTVVSHGSGHAGRQVAAALTGEPAPPGAAARVARGWDSVLDSVRELTR